MEATPAQKMHREAWEAWEKADNELIAVTAEAERVTEEAQRKVVIARRAVEEAHAAKRYWEVIVDAEKASVGD
jgi:hypothetical protein